MPPIVSLDVVAVDADKQLPRFGGDGGPEDFKL